MLEFKERGTDVDKIFKKIAEELSIRESQVEATVKLIDEGNTIPFIARYRKEVTGNLSDETLRDLGERLTYLRNLEKRKEEIIRLIDEQGKLVSSISINEGYYNTPAYIRPLMLKTLILHIQLLI